MGSDPFIHTNRDSPCYRADDENSDKLVIVGTLNTEAILDEIRERNDEISDTSTEKWEFDGMVDYGEIEYDQHYRGERGREYARKMAKMWDYSDEEIEENVSEVEDAKYPNVNLEPEQIAVILKRKKLESPEFDGCKTMRLFHGTQAKIMECINKEGMKSVCAQGAESPPWFKGIPAEKDLIWFTDDKELAMHHTGGYFEGDGIVITADVEVCNPLPWNRPIGDDIAKAMNSQIPDIPCPDLQRFTALFDAEEDGLRNMEQAAKYCSPAGLKFLGQVAKEFGFQSFHEVISPDRWLNRGANNWAVTDDADIKIVEQEIVKNE
ncbi:MAG: hypothetical protein ACTSPB_20135 [Candidatus Thorarchaeota archaeon]